MKVKAKDLLFSSLPSKKDKKKLLKAEDGFQNPGDPRIKNMVKSLPDDYFDIFGGQPQRSDTQHIQPTGATGPDTSGIIPGMHNPSGNLSNQQTYHNPIQHQRGNPLLLGLAAVDAAISGEDIRKQNVIRPEEHQVYNQHPYGTGSQALAYGGSVGDPNQSKPKDKPTTSDSLALYNNSRQVRDYYLNNWDYHKVGTPIKKSASSMFKENDEAVQSIKNNNYSIREPDAKSSTKITPEEYRKNVDGNKYYQRDLQSLTLDMNAPMSLYDKRISPQYSTDYANSQTGDMVNLNQYDPIAVKPWNTLTPDERKERISKYGDPTKPHDEPSPAKRSKVQGPQQIDKGKPNVGAPIGGPGQLAGGPTNFSFTGRNDQGQQDTRYFSDLDSWKAGTDKMGYRWRNETDNGKQATASGYQFYTGGQLMSNNRTTPIIIPEGVEDNMPSAKDGKWIQKAINPKNKGYCTPMTKSTCTGRRRALAETFKKHHGFHKGEDGMYIPNVTGETEQMNYQGPEGGFLPDSLKYGGIIPDNMSNFSPHRYENGGTARGGSDTFDILEQYIMYHNGGTLPDMLGHIIHHPNEVDMEGWRYGGTTRGGSDTPNIFEQIVMHPSMDDMSGYNPRGWDQAASGKTLSRRKAAEILHDGTAHGKKITDKQRKYFGAVASGYAADGTNIGGGPGDIGEPTSAQDDYYRSSATLSYYKNQLNDKLKAKNPQAFGSYFKGLNDLRTAGKTKEADQYVQDNPYSDYLSPEEVKSTLGENYDKYLTSLKAVNTYNVQQGKQPLYGQKEGEGDPSTLNYGRRFASLQMTPTFSTSKGQSKYSRNYTYDPKKGVNYTETGDLSLTPSFLGGNQQKQVATNTDPAQKAQVAGNQGTLRDGGIMYADGGTVDTMWGGDVQPISSNPYDGGTMQFNGASHADGGIGMHYNGQPVEVEGGETASKDKEGNLTVFGNMHLPGTRTKFKDVVKEMGQKEKNYQNLKSTGAKLVNDSNPANRFEQLSFNAGKVMMSGGDMGQKDLAQKKDKLANLQKAMLETSDQYGIDPHEMSKGNVRKAKKGIKIAADGYSEENSTQDPNDPGRSTRNKNPGNIKYGKFAKAHGATGQDKDGFAIFPDPKVGATAMKTLLTSDKYKNMDIHDAIKDWTGKHPYKYTLGPELEGKKVSDLNENQLSSLMGIMTKGEDTRYGAPPTRATPPPIQPVQPFTPYHVPDVPISPDRPTPINPRGATPPPIDHLDIPGRPNIPTNAEPLHLNEVLGEIYAAATNKQEPVVAQKYTPEQYIPYQVSFQDRLNQNENTYDSIRRTVGSGNTASALGSLAASKYNADDSVKAEEFRTNQGISNDITNKNIGLENDAQLKNLGIADQQYVRQSTAKSKTKEMNQMIINSISGKYAQNDLNNKRLKAYENLYDYRFVPTEGGGDVATYFGPNAAFNFNQDDAAARNSSRYDKTATRTDQYGNVKSVTSYKDDELKQRKQELDIEMQRRKLPLLSVPELFWGGHLEMK